MRFPTRHSLVVLAALPLAVSTPRPDSRPDHLLSNARSTGLARDASRPATVSVVSAPPARPKDYRDLGEHDDKCSFDEDADEPAKEWCNGYFGPVWTSGSDVDRARFAKAVNWPAAPTTYTKRLLMDNSTANIFKVVVAKKSKQWALHDLGTQSVVVARLTVKAKSTIPDAKYGISNSASTDVDYYFVVNNFSATQNDKDDGRAMADWTLWKMITASGIDQLQKTTVTGTFRYCRHKHDQTQRVKGADFLSCSSAGFFLRWLKTSEKILLSLASRYETDCVPCWAIRLLTDASKVL